MTLSLPGTGSEQLSLGPPCERAQSAWGCAVCLSVRHGHISSAGWTHDEAMERGEWKKNLALCQVLFLPLALGQRFHLLIPWQCRAPFVFSLATFPHSFLNGQLFSLWIMFHFHKSTKHVQIRWWLSSQVVLINSAPHSC